MALPFTVVAHKYICDKWLLIVLHLTCTQHDKSMCQQKIDMQNTGFWKLCMAVMHVDTMFFFYYTECNFIVQKESKQEVLRAFC